MRILIKNAKIVNENKIYDSDVLIENDKIKDIQKDIKSESNHIICAEGMYLIPGVIDDQVHFREPGFFEKGTIYTESKAAVAGGITTFMEMPNTKPQALTQKLLENKFEIASKSSLANYSFFMGVSNDNLEEVLNTDPRKVAAIKIFMGSSTGDMLVDDREVLEKIFKHSKMLIAVHCEDEETIQNNIINAKKVYGEKIPISEHAKIRSADACYKSSSMAVELAKKYNTRLHVFHISTEKELSLFSNDIPLSKKRITSEACIHHLWFDNTDYKEKGTLIKWNPSIKKPSDKEALLAAVLDNRIDVIATDHAPHTLKEKQNNYLTAPSGGPLVQHALNAMLEMYKEKRITLEHIVQKMCHDPAICFQIKKRGFVRKGYFADLVLVDLNKSWVVSKDNLLYKCKWSPFEGQKFNSKITYTIINGHIVYDNGVFHEEKKGERITFNR
tara:strand:+ start:1795 stop:3126 length:1332 start_codon:yes stop_codon:yes gene_type:complete